MVRRVPRGAFTATNFYRNASIVNDVLVLGTPLFVDRPPECAYHQAPVLVLSTFTKGAVNHVNDIVRKNALYACCLWPGIGVGWVLIESQSMRPRWDVLCA